jgi:hypothetical protein
VKNLTTWTLRWMAVAMLLTVAGCSQKVANLADQSYQEASDIQWKTFVDAHRVAEQQMLLATIQFVEKNHGDLDKLKSGLVESWEAHRGLYLIREQYMMARMMSEMTVGAYFGSLETNVGNTVAKFLFPMSEESSNAK